MAFVPKHWPRRLRSQEWYGGTSRDHIYYRRWPKNQGYPHDLFGDRPVIGISNTWSDLTPCNTMGTASTMTSMAEVVGMAEVGNMGLPPKVLRRGIEDMIRISDARMSGTAYGTEVAHDPAADFKRRRADFPRATQGRRT